MADVSVKQRVEKWIVDKLVSSATLKTTVGKHPTLNMWQFYKGLAPQGATFPHIIFFQESGGRQSFYGRLAYIKPVYIIKIVDQGDVLKRIRTGMDELEILFRKDQLSNNEEIVGGCHIIGDIDYTEVIEGVRYNHEGVRVSFFSHVQV